MNHQVLNDANIRAAEGKAAESLRLDESWRTDSAERILDSRIEAFHMSNLDNVAVSTSKCQQVEPFGESSGYRLFDQQVLAGDQQIARNLMVQRRRRGDDRGVKLIQNFAGIAHRSQVKLLNNLLLHQRLGVADRNQLDARVRFQQTGVNLP